MTLHHYPDTHSHEWLISPNNPLTALRRDPLTVGRLTVENLTLAAPDADTLAASIAAHDRLENP